MEDQAEQLREIMKNKSVQTPSSPKKTRIITVASGVTWLTLSGVILLFRSFRRQDFAYLLDPIERLREGRAKG